MPERPTHAEQRMLSAMATMTDEIRALQGKVGSLEGKFGPLEIKVSETKDIVEAWGAVKTLGKFIKWLGALVAAVTAVAIGVKLGVQHLFGRSGI
ncbi:hypothetical protein [Novosphingobium sp. BL-52-GroH]|uniref:hypothetical protein n=1 Tax=Novosphingobium sp. BL-52-GroH TaxID=3349877 RepID=UPI00384F397C